MTANGNYYLTPRLRIVSLVANYVRVEWVKYVVDTVMLVFIAYRYS